MRALAIMISLVVASPAVAGPQEVEQAKARFKQGKAYQDVGQYEKAAAEYEAAYQLDPRPEMLFNIAQAYRLAAKKQQALDYFKRYLDAQPSGAGADEARRHVAALTKELEDEQRTAQPPPVVPPPVAPPPPAPEQPVLAETRYSPPLRIAGLATAGAGVIALGVGVKLGLDARGHADAITNKDMSAWTAEDRRRFEDGEAANRNMIIAYTVGGALVIGGAVMYVVGSRTQLTPVVGTQSAGLAVAGRF